MPQEKQFKEVFMGRWKFLLFALTISCEVAFAVAPDCKNPVTSADISLCSRQSNEVSERELNRVYQSVLGGLSTIERQFKEAFPGEPAAALRDTLILAEREWAKYRDMSCRLEAKVVLIGNPNRDDHSSITEAGCRAGYARIRIAQLIDFAKTYGVPLDR
jgi:uncharacterized protein YecT (DUF1311 family)